ncbi:MAG: SpoVG family protein [Ruminococcus sp.]|nr:SpoVG family protein [Ruminococcus sp.]
MSNSKENITPEAAENNDLKLEVSVRPIAPRNNLVGFATVTINDSFAVENIRVCKGEKGLYVNMPSQQDSQGNWRDVFKPITAESRKLLISAILNGYTAAIDKMRETVDATKEADKPSLTGALKDNAGKVKSQPKKTAGKSEQSL